MAKIPTDKVIKGKSLSEDLMNATLDGLGIKEEDVKDKDAMKRQHKNMAKAIAIFIQNQDLKINKLKAVTELEEVGVEKDLPVDVAPNTLLGPYGPLLSGIKKIPGASGVISAIEGKLKKVVQAVSSAGASLPFKLSKSKGLKAQGYTYCGQHNVQGKTKETGVESSSVGLNDVKNL